MRRFLEIFLNLILLISLLKPQETFAATCRITTSPSSDSRLLNINVNTTGILRNKEDGNTDKYWVKLDSDFIDGYTEGALGEHGYPFEPSNGAIRIQNVNSQGILNPPSNFTATFESRTYSVTVQESKSGGSIFCTGSFEAQQTRFAGTCEIKFLNDPQKDPDAYSIKSDIKIRVDNLSGNTGDTKKIVIKRNKVNGPEVPGKTSCESVSSLQSGLNIGKFDAGVYYIEILKSCVFTSDVLCSDLYAIGEKGGFGPSPGPIATPPPICKGGFCETALGKIFTDPANFVKSFFGILLSLAGGVAIILIIFSGYRLMSSGGNPEKVQAAREQLTSAIVGLLFIIFSLSILQIIGVDILRIPGLTK